MLTSPARLCWPCCLAGPAHPAATAGFSIREGEIPRETDCLLEGSGFELPVPQCALSSPTARPWSRPPYLAVSGGALNGHLTTPIGGRPATPRLTRREDRSAQLGRGPEDLVIGRQRTIGFLTGSAASAVCPDRSSRVTKSRSSINVTGRFSRLRKKSVGGASSPIRRLLPLRNPLI
jgi:hypothetical protein